MTQGGVGSEDDSRQEDGSQQQQMQTPGLLFLQAMYSGSASPSARILGTSTLVVSSLLDMLGVFQVRGCGLGCMACVDDAGCAALHVAMIRATLCRQCLQTRQMAKCRVWWSTGA